MSEHHYRPGNWRVICDRCGQEFYASELRLEWTNLRVCRTCFDYRHPQDFVRGVTDKQSPPWTRPEAPDEFVDIRGFDDGFDDGFG